MRELREVRTRRARSRWPTWPEALAGVALTTLLLPGVPLEASAQRQTDTDQPVSEVRPGVIVYSAKKPKKMPQEKRRKIKDAKIKKAQEFESVSGGPESLVSTTDYDTLGNARGRLNHPANGATINQTVDVDIDRDVVTKLTSVSTVHVEREGSPPEDLTETQETSFAYDEVDFDDGKDYLLRTLESKRQGVSVGKMDHEYDANGRLKKLVQNQLDGDGSLLAKRATTEFTYDDHDRVIEVVTHDNRHHDLNPTEDRIIARQVRHYGADGQVSRIENLAPDLRDLPPGTDPVVSFSEYTYDNLLTLQTYRRLPGPAGPEDVLISEETHTYDSDGNEVETTLGLPEPPSGDPPPGGLPPGAFGIGHNRHTTRTFDKFGNVLTEETVETDGGGQELSRRMRRIVYENFIK